MFPLVSSAAPLTASQRASIEAELQVLETELASLLASLPSTTSSEATSTEVSTGQVTATVTPAYSYPSAEGILFNDTVTVSNGTASSVYVPTNMTYIPTNSSTTNVPGFAYTIGAGIDSVLYSGTQSPSVTCSPIVDLQEQTGYYEACEIQPGQSVQLQVQIIPTANSKGEYELSLTSFDYTTTTSNSPFTVLPLPNNQTNYVNF